jgi:hypothetical protein
MRKAGSGDQDSCIANGGQTETERRKWRQEGRRGREREREEHCQSERLNLVLTLLSVFSLCLFPPSSVAPVPGC